MKKLPYLFLGLWCLGFAASTPCQTAPDGKAAVLTVTGTPSLKPIHPGSAFSVAVLARIQPGWHVNAHEGLPPYFISAELSLAPGSAASLVLVRYPQGQPEAVAGVEKPFPVYQGTVTFFADLRLSANAKGSKTTLSFDLKYQSCNNQVCLAPADLKIKVTLDIAPGGIPSKPFHPELFTPESASSRASTPVPPNLIARLFQEKGIFLTFILVFLAGLALNLTPCVYPMIPLTVSYFGGMKEEKALAVLGRAAAYVVGISVTYSSLGVTAALTGRILGSTLQSPWVLCGISLILAVLAGSMFGLFEIQPPAWLLNKVTSGSTRGWLGAFGMGLAFGVVAAPCVDPFSIGLLTFVAEKANPFLGFILFFTLSLGLGFPYLWLGFFSGEMKRLPKSGVWMVWVKKVFGTILLGMPFYFLNSILPFGFNHYAVPVFLILAGVGLGWLAGGTGIHPVFRRFQNVFGLLLIVIGAWIYLTWPKPVELPFEAYSSERLQEAQQRQQPVLIDFSAAWCIPCQEMMMKTFPEGRVQQALKSWVLLEADLTQYSSAPVEELKHRYDIQGVPTLVFIDGSGNERNDLTSVGFLSADQLLEQIDRVNQP